MGKIVNGHELISPSECNCAPDNWHCPVCQGGLGICGFCGAAERELEIPCSRQRAVAGTKGTENTLVYLAVPYSHEDPNVKEERFRIVNKVAAELMLQGLHIFSPISHTHPIACAGEMPGGWEFWRAYDEAILRHCIRLIVLKLPGWQESVGVAGEIEIATVMGIPIEYLEAPQP